MRLFASVRGGEARSYRLLLLAHTVQNFSLKPPSSAGLAGAWGCCWPFVCEVSVLPSRPMVVVSGTSSGGGGGGGGCARRLGSVDMIVSGCQVRRSVCYRRRRVLHVKMETAALRRAQARAPHHLAPQALADGPRHRSFRLPRYMYLVVADYWNIMSTDRKVQSNCVSCYGSWTIHICQRRIGIASHQCKEVSSHTQLYPDRSHHS